MSTWNKIFFVILATASLFSVAYMTGLIKETRYVHDSVIQEAEYDKECIELEESKRDLSSHVLPPWHKDEPLPKLPNWTYPQCITKEAVWGYADCDFKRKAARIEYCFGIKEFSPMKTGVLALVSLTGLMYFKIKRNK